MLTAKFTGSGRSKTLDKLVTGAEARLAQGVNRAVLRVEREVKLELSKGGSAGSTRSARIRGRVRIYPRNETNHLRVITGDLRSSWRHRLARKVGTTIEGHVFSDSAYARIHEFGGLSGSRAGRFIMRKRPYVSPALKTAEPSMMKDMVAAYMRPVR